MKHRTMSLYRRIILLAAAVAAVSALLVGVYGALYLRGMISEERTGRALAEAKLLAEVLADPIYNRDLRRIREVVGGVGDGDLLGIEVADAEGQIIFRTGDPGAFLEGARLGPLPEAGRVSIEHAGRVLSLVVPIEVPGAPPLGYLRLAEDMSVFKDYILRPTLRFAAAGFLLAILAGLVGGMVARRVVRPIEALARGVRRLGQGEAASLPTERNDEIGALARAFSEVFAKIGYLQAAIEQAPTPVILTDRGQKIFYVNPAFSTLSGFSPEEVLGKNPEVFRAYGEGREVIQREEVGHIQKAGRHLLALINEVLDVARVDAGRVALSLEPVLAEEVVREVLDLSGPIASQAGVRLHPPSGHGLARYAYADRQRLMQVLLNLVTNAIRYNRAGGEVWVRVLVGEETLRFEVEDTGIGIAEATRDRVFEPFDRLGRERGGGEGTGLGLSIAKRFVELMGGEIGFESREGHGTTFHFVLPQAPPPREESGERAGDDPDGGYGLTLLYIEDNPANLRLIESLCARIGAVRIIAALQGGLGLRLAREHRPDVIILDMELPDMSGEAVLARLKGDLKTREIPVIVLSASASPNRIDRVLSAGAYAYLTKPLEVKRFLELLSELGRGR